MEFASAFSYVYILANKCIQYFLITLYLLPQREAGVFLFRCFTPNSVLHTHYSLLHTHYSLLHTHYSILLTHYSFTNLLTSIPFSVFTFTMYTPFGKSATFMVIGEQVYRLSVKRINLLSKQVKYLYTAYR